MAGQNIFRVAFVAVGLSTLSFAAGIAGDLTEPPRSGQRVVLRIPPEIPSDAPRARPLLSTASADAASFHANRRARRARRAELTALVEAVQVAHEESYGLTSLAVEIAAADVPKPLVDPRVKPQQQALLERHAAKAA